ncbi:MAG: 5-methyltetrahydropteroyltriglutamate--homocysteine S-methyltransferase [Alphaproteobacteria bacterium]|nr:MAG: 5-methyltetrahydropteroyltriglutamate--homocysteine S-methyltransferase [Alphaproteobacteria bacterium]
MVTSANLGFPRIGFRRELKNALESFWHGETSETELQSVAKELRQRHWKLQQDSGIDIIPCNDFTLYDHVLDTIAMTGAIPAQYKWDGKPVKLATYFAMARGQQGHVHGPDCGHHHHHHDHGNELDVAALDMTKWFDTNYHYIVPVFHVEQKFSLSTNKVVDEFNEAKALGIKARPVLLGPVSFLLLGKMPQGGSPIDLLDRLLPVYAQVLKNLAAAGAEWVQIDEPCLVTDLDDKVRAAYQKAYETLSAAAPKLKIMLATYFESLDGNLETALQLPVAGLHVDLVRAPQQLKDVLAKAPKHLVLSLGIVDGRNIWKNDFKSSLAILKTAVDAVGKDRVQIAPSCSLLHTPIDLAGEIKLDEKIKNWMAYAKQKLEEVSVIARALRDGEASVKTELAANEKSIADRASSKLIHNADVKKRSNAVTDDMMKRGSVFKTRKEAQAKVLQIPAFPTTTIGSFPQTKEVRAARAEFKSGKRDKASYEFFLKDQIKQSIRLQENLGIDVLVHGEFERNDMVEYFGEQLEGITFSQNGWVQSYGSRCVKPPIIFGDVSRKGPMTVRWSSYAQSLTDRPVKGMLTGPITILQWSFVRNDQPRSETAKQIALAIRDEAVDLETAGIKAIQIDEPAIREGLPIHRKDWNAYLDWAVKAFRLSASGVRDDTQIHTHMCYSEFNDIMDSIAAMDADVISIETARSAMEILNAFVSFKYPNQIGPGLYDIHSPRVPSAHEMLDLLHKAKDLLPPDNVWVNPDCGLKTRGWPETEAALANMVACARAMRRELGLPDTVARLKLAKVG